MTAPADNTVAWFQVGTTDAEQAKRFYGDLFGWRYTLDPNSEGKYHLVSYPGTDTPSGGIIDTGGEFPDHASRTGPPSTRSVPAPAGAEVRETPRVNGAEIRCRGPVRPRTLGRRITYAAIPARCLAPVRQAGLRPGDRSAGKRRSPRR